MISRGRRHRRTRRAWRAHGGDVVIRSPATIAPSASGSSTRAGPAAVSGPSRPRPRVRARHRPQADQVFRSSVSSEYITATITGPDAEPMIGTRMPKSASDGTVYSTPATPSSASLATRRRRTRSASGSAIATAIATEMAGQLGGAERGGPDLVLVALDPVPSDLHARNLARAVRPCATRASAANNSAVLGATDSRGRAGASAPALATRDAAGGRRPAARSGRGPDEPADRTERRSSERIRCGCPMHHGWSWMQRTRPPSPARSRAPSTICCSYDSAV